MANWYTEHPVVSTVLWLMGSAHEIVEDEDDNPKISSKSRTLSWKDEHDGPIAEYLGSPKATEVVRSSNKKTKETVNKEGASLSKKEEAEDKHFSRKQSLTTLPRNDSDVCCYCSEVRFQNNLCFRLKKVAVMAEILKTNLIQHLPSGAGMYLPPLRRRCMVSDPDDNMYHSLFICL